MDIGFGMKDSPIDKRFNLLTTTSLTLQLSALFLGFVELRINSVTPYFILPDQALIEMARNYFNITALLWCTTFSFILIKRPELNTRNIVTVLSPLIALAIIWLIHTSAFG